MFCKKAVVVAVYGPEGFVREGGGKVEVASWKSGFMVSRGTAAVGLRTSTSTRS